MSPRVPLRIAELTLVVTVAIVLPATVRDTTLYLELAGPCLIGAVALGYLDGRDRER